MNRAAALTALQALANDARLDLVRLLMPLGTNGLAAGEIGRALGLAASRLSFHLAALEQAQLIQSRKEGRKVYYSVDAAGLGATIAYLLNDCCMEHPEVIACCCCLQRPPQPPQQQPPQHPPQHPLVTPLALRADQDGSPQ